MQNIELSGRISELEREIAMLPEGSITKKKVNGKDYYYKVFDCTVLLEMQSKVYIIAA